MFLAWDFEINNKCTFYVDAELQAINDLFAHSLWL